MLSVDAPPFGPASHSIARSLSMRFARHQLSATTATASSSFTTLMRPRSPLIRSSATVTSLPRNTGHCAIAAYAMPGSCTSIPKRGFPLTLSGMSKRCAALPIRFHSLGSFSFTSFGGSSFEAACATWPKRSFLFDGVCVITPFSASHSDAGTFHLCAAAATSISRAADRLAAAGGHRAPHPVAADLLRGRDEFRAHLRPIALELLGDEHGKAGGAALPHLRARHADEDAVVGIDHDPRRQLGGFGSSGEHRRRQRQLKREPSAKRGRDLEKF